MSKPNSENDGGFPLPEIVDPPRIEFCISVPDDPTHLRAFWGAMWELTRWYNWQKKDDQQAKPVADVWLQVWLENQDRYEERLCMPPEACCDDTNDLLRQILATIQGGFKIVPFTSEQASDFTVDCTPDNFNGNDDQAPIEAIKRQNALCLAVNRWLVSVLGNRADKMNQSGKFEQIWALGGFTDAPKMYASIQYVEFAFTVAQLQAIIDHETAFQLVACRIIAELANEGNTFSVFKKSMQTVYDEISAGEEVEQTLVALVAQKYATDRVNYTLFSRELEKAYDDISDDLGYECLCFGEVCDPADFDIIAVNDCTVTRLTDTTWHVTQTNHVPFNPTQRTFEAHVRDANWRCFHHSASTQAEAGYGIYNCAGVYSSGTGGGGGIVVQSGWYHVENNVDPVVGIDTIITIICPP